MYTYTTRSKNLVSNTIWTKIKWTIKYKIYIIIFILIQIVQLTWIRLCLVVTVTRINKVLFNCVVLQRQVISCCRRPSCWSPGWATWNVDGAPAMGKATLERSSQTNTWVLQIRLRIIRSQLWRPRNSFLRQTRSAFKVSKNLLPKGQQFWQI